MNRSFVSRSLLLAGLLAATTAAQGASLLDDEVSQQFSATETWVFPDDSQPQTLAGLTISPAEPDTTSMGAGAAPVVEESGHAPSHDTQTWFFPDGSQTVMPTSLGDLL